MTGIIATVVFVAIWYAMTLIGRALLKPYEKLKLVWCPEVRSFSFVETEPKADSSSVSVKRCLLWPEHEGCKRRCIKLG